MHGMMMGPNGVVNMESGATCWFTSLPETGETSTVMTTPRGILWYQDGKARYAAWSDPPEAIVRQAVDLAHRQQWDELAVLVKLAQAM